MWIGRLFVLHTGHFTLHAFSALVFFGFDVECWKSRLPYAMKRKFAVRKQLVWTADTIGDWRVVSYRLFFAAVLIGCWESRVPHGVILLALIGCEQEPNIPHDHLLILTLTHVRFSTITFHRYLAFQLEDHPWVGLWVALYTSRACANLKISFASFLRSPAVNKRVARFLAHTSLEAIPLHRDTLRLKLSSFVGSFIV